MKKIVIPTDFSENAFHAGRFGISMFQGEDVTFYILHTFMVPYGTEDLLISLNDILQEEALASLERAKENFEKEFPGARIVTKLKIGYTVTTIEKFVSNINADLVIMGSRGSGFYSDKLIGNITSSVIRRVSCPVLIVPGKAAIRKPARIVLATDHKTRPEEVELVTIKNLAEKFSSEVLILNILTGKDKLNGQEENIFENQLHNLKHNYYSRRNDDVAEEINSFIDEKHAGMVSVVAGDYSMFERIFHHSVTRDIVLHSEVPVLVLHGKKIPPAIKA